jgi:glyoxylase-like metal-dependent hydrolase (beta-lactamase superfamily II)
MRKYAMNPEVQHFYHEPSGTFSYVISDPETSQAAIIDSVLGFSVVSGRLDYGPAELVIAYVEERGLSIEWILETHAHADHLSAAAFLQERLGGKVAIGEGIKKVQSHFGPVFNLGSAFATDGTQFDHLFADNDEIDIGNLRCRVIHTPGHTNDSVTYVIGNAAFAGDTLFMTDFGTARCDFPGGDAGLLYDSIQKLFALPGATMIYLCHDYPPEDRPLQFATPLAEQKETNIHVGGGAERNAYVAMRETRDATLGLPALILPSIQVNIQAGKLPAAEDNEIAYIKIPLDTL